MIIGLTGSFGAGKGENMRGMFARPCPIFFEASAESKISARCTAPVGRPFRAESV
jgi:hypothetical protein